MMWVLIRIASSKKVWSVGAMSEESALASAQFDSSLHCLNGIDLDIYVILLESMLSV